MIGVVLSLLLDFRSVHSRYGKLLKRTRIWISLLTRFYILFYDSLFFFLFGSDCGVLTRIYLFVYQIMVATVRCEEIANEKLIRLTSDKVRLCSSSFPRVASRLIWNFIFPY